MALRSIPMKDTPWSTPHGVCLMGLTLYLNVQLHRLVIYPLKKCPSLPKCVSSQQLWQQYWANVTKIQHYNHSNMFTQCRWKTTKMAENVTFTSIYRFQTWGGANANASEQFVPKYLIYKKVFEKTNTFFKYDFLFHIPFWIFVDGISPAHLIINYFNHVPPVCRIHCALVHRHQQN